MAIVATFTGAGSLGLSFEGKGANAPPTIKVLKPGTQAQEHEGVLSKGMTLRRVGETSCKGLAYKDVRGLIKGVSVLCTRAAKTFTCGARPFL